MDAHPEGSDPVSKLGCSPLGGGIEYPPAYASMCRKRRLKGHCIGGRRLANDVPQHWHSWVKCGRGKSESAKSGAGETLNPVIRLCVSHHKRENTSDSIRM